EHLTACFFSQGFHNFKRRRFSCAVRTQQTEYFSLINAKADPFYGFKMAIVLYQVLYGNYFFPLHDRQDNAVKDYDKLFNTPVMDACLWPGADRAATTFKVLIKQMLAFLFY